MTADIRHGFGHQNYFNSHARVGRDRSSGGLGSTLGDFNSHARVGRDDTTINARALVDDFNSHARVGRDPLENVGLHGLQISTHTPV